MYKLAKAIPAGPRRRLEVFLIDRGWRPPRSRGSAGIEQLGHRAYVGSADHFDELGLRQFEFMLDHGLQPDDVLCDIGCGSLRGGCRFIDYLQAGHYLGLEGEAELVELGLRKELDVAVYEAKRPEFVFSYDFAFDQFSRSPTYALAVSVFSHLNEQDIRSCLAKLAARVTGRIEFFASYFECERPVPNFKKSHPHLGFYYTCEQMKRFGTDAGWTPLRVGEWGSPSGQQMMKYSIAR